MKETTIWGSGAYKNWEVAIFVMIFLLIGFLLGFSRNKIDYTENMKDCISKGGRYYLSVENGSNWNYEKCTVEKDISY